MGDVSGSCGSCWAFSATETLESHLAIATGEPAPVLSPQQIVSCAPNPQHCGGTGGCQGSTQPLAFNYTKDAGITTESNYPYRGVTGKCDQSKITPVATNDGFVLGEKQLHRSCHCGRDQGPNFHQCCCWWFGMAIVWRWCLLQDRSSWLQLCHGPCCP